MNLNPIEEFKPLCPVCGSNDVVDHRGGMDKMFGIKEHWACRKCGADW